MSSRSEGGNSAAGQGLIAGQSGGGNLGLDSDKPEAGTWMKLSTSSLKAAQLHLVPGVCGHSPVLTIIYIHNLQSSGVSAFKMTAVYSRRKGFWHPGFFDTNILRNIFICFVFGICAEI